jgi:DNA-binding response OmpR family regulator
MLNETVHTENARLRNRIAELEAEIERRDRTANSDVGQVMLATGLTISLARMLMALCKGVPMGRDQLAVLCRHAEFSDPRLVDSQIKRLRRRLKTCGIEVKTLYGVGYALTGSHLAAARAFMKGELQ